MFEIIAIDPGETHSAFVYWDGAKVRHSAVISNEKMLTMLYELSYPAPRDLSCNISNEKMPTMLYESTGFAPLVIEWVSGFGIPAGNSVFETCRWVGRFQEAYGGTTYLVTRKKVKEHLQAVNDKFVRQALIARFGEPGSKKNPGVLYGIASHRLAALAVAVTWLDLNGGSE